LLKPIADIFINSRTNASSSNIDQQQMALMEKLKTASR